MTAILYKIAAGELFARRQASLSDQLFAGDGATLLPGALVQATDAASGFFLKAASTDAAGHYRLERVSRF